MKYLITLLACAALGSSFGQLTWADDAAEVFYEKCTQCHHNGGIGPFSLMDYSAANAMQSQIYTSVFEGTMPPWPPDTSYQHFSHERILNEDQRNTLLNWITDGAQEGNPANAPAPPVYTVGSALSQTPDLTIQMPAYASKASLVADDYVCFALPTGLPTDKKVKAIEIIPGNTEIVHHCLVYMDSSNTYPTDTNGVCGGPTEGLMAGYTPGANPTIFPGGGSFNMGMMLYANSNVVLAMHYPEGSAGMVDSTKVNFYFYDDNVSIREIQADAIIQNWSFACPPNAVTPVSASFPPPGEFIPVPISMLSVFPHMHLIGKDIKSYAVTPANDTLDFISIPHWDFEWQDFYWFKNMKMLPAFSTVYGEGHFDNTVNNPHNPNNPPITVYAGLNTTDEMFLVYFHYALYQAGDELIDVEQLNSDYLASVVDLETPDNIGVYPNPFKEQVAISMDLTQNSKVSVHIYDLSGRRVKRLIDRKLLTPGDAVAFWRGDDEQGTPVAPGLYIYSVKIDGAVYSGKLIKR